MMTTARATRKALERGFDGNGPRRSIGRDPVALAQRIETLEGRLMAAVSVLEVLFDNGHMPPHFAETVDRVIRRSNQAINGGRTR